jgi:hypothetical protein
MLKNIRLLKEQNDPQYRSNPIDPAANQENGNERSEEYDVDGEKLILSTASGLSLELTDDIRNTFTTSNDEFNQQVSDLVDLNSLHVHDNTVQWSGRLTKFDLEFSYVVGENDGVFIKGEKIKVDEELTTLLNQLTQFYQAFTQKWSPVLTSRHQGKQETGIQ